jgi:hypothetical protein
MNGDVCPGKMYLVTHEIVINGVVAFGKGESVQIEKVDPNPTRPQFKYIVLSPKLGQRFQLSDNDLAKQSFCVGCGEALPLDYTASR